MFKFLSNRQTHFLFTFFVVTASTTIGYAQVKQLKDAQASADSALWPKEPDNSALVADYEKKRAASSSEFIEKKIPDLSVSNRVTDPFGAPLRTPLDLKGVALASSKKTSGTAESETKNYSILVSDALKTLVINGVNAKDSEVLIGSDSLLVGDAFDVMYMGEQYRAWVKSVSDTRIVFVSPPSNLDVVVETRIPNRRPPQNIASGYSGTTSNMPPINSHP